MVRVSSPAKLRPWSELTAQNGDGGGSCVGERRVLRRVLEIAFEQWVLTKGSEKGSKKGLSRR